MTPHLLILPWHMDFAILPQDNNLSGARRSRNRSGAVTGREPVPAFADAESTL